MRATPFTDYDLSPANRVDAAWLNSVDGQLRTIPTGAVADDATDNTAIIQAAITAMTGGGVLYFPAASLNVYRTGALTVPNANVKFLLDKGVTLRFTTLGVSVNAITVTANWFELEGGKLQGPTASGGYVSEEHGIYSAGTSVAAPRIGLRVRNTEITGFGSSAICGKFLQDVVIQGNYIHDIGYAGIYIFSSVNGRILSNTIKTITPGAAGDIYGLTLTHISTNYNTNPNPGTKQATYPFCWDWVVDGNHIEDINWAGIDTHGGYEITVTNNHVYNTKRGIEVAGGSGNASGYAGWNNSIIGNVVDADSADGLTTSRRNQGPGIGVNGGSTLKHVGVVVADNVLRYKGVLGTTTSGAISAQATVGAVIVGNTVNFWGGAGVHYGNSSGGTNISNNVFGGLGGTTAGSEYTIHTDTPDTQFPTITGNVIAVNGGIAPVDGFRGGIIVNLPFFQGNNFSGVSSGEYITPATFVVRSEGLPTLVATVNNAGGGAAVALDLAAMGRYRQFIVSVTSSNAASEVNDLSNTVIGQEIWLYSPAATAWKFVRSPNAALPAGADFTASQYDVQKILKVAASGTKFVGSGTSVNS